MKITDIDDGFDQFYNDGDDNVFKYLNSPSFDSVSKSGETASDKSKLTLSPKDYSNVTESREPIGYEFNVNNGSFLDFDPTEDSGWALKRQSNGRSRLSHELTLESLYSMVVNMYQHINYLEQGMTQTSRYPLPTMVSASFNGGRKSDCEAIRNRDLDPICLPLFRQKPNPSNTDFIQLCRVLERSNPKLERKRVLSALRRWFRKKRDENGQKVFSACTSILLPRIEAGISIDDLRDSLAQNSQLFNAISEQALLEISDPNSASVFLREKIESFLSRRVERRRSL